ncbi:MAG: CARDB domain-containing protein [Bacteroidales bacterium]
MRKIFTGLFCVLLVNSGFTQEKIVQYRYWLDTNYSSRVVQILDPPQDSLVLNEPISMAGVSLGPHTIHFQFRDALNRWSAATTDSIFVGGLPLPVGPISGPDTVYSGQVDLVYSVPPVGNATSYIWTFPPGFLFYGNSNSVIVFATPDAQSGYVTVKGYNPHGVGDSAIMFITVEPSVEPDKKLVAWRYWFDQADSNTVTVSLPVPQDSLVLNEPISMAGVSFGPHTIHFQFKDALNRWSAATTDSIFVGGLPFPVGPISGPDTVYSGQVDLVYSVPPVGNATSYVWTFPPGFLFYGNSNSVIVFATPDAQSGYVTVKGHNPIGDGDSASMYLTVLPSVEPDKKLVAWRYWFDHADSNTVTVDLPVPQDSLVLNEPISMAGVSFGPHTIHFQFKDALNRWSAATTDSIFVGGLPLPVGTISGPDTVYCGQVDLVYSVPPVGNATSYIWTFPPGFLFYGNSNSVIVFATPGAQSGYVTVKGHNPNGDGDSASMYLTVLPSVEPDKKLVAWRYWFDQADSNTVTISLPVPQDSLVLDEPISMAGVSLGPHTIHFQFKDAMNRWSAATTDFIFVGGLPLPVGPISGPDTVYSGQVDLVYYVPPVGNATSYIWTFPPGFLFYGNSSSVIVFATPEAQSGYVTVKGRNPNGDGDSAIMFITVQPSIEPDKKLVAWRYWLDEADSIAVTVALPLPQDSLVLDQTINMSDVSWGQHIIHFQFRDALNRWSAVTSDSIFVGGLPYPAGPINGPQIVCQGQENISFSIPPIINATSYIWNFPQGFTVSGNTSTITVDAALNAVAGMITVKGLNPHGFGDSASMEIDIQSPIVSFAGEDDTICQGSSVVLNATGGETYYWSPALGLSDVSSPSPTASPQQTTTYTLSVTSGACTDSDTLTVFVNIPRISTPAFNQTLCSGAPTQEIRLNSPDSITVINWTAQGPSFLYGFSTSGVSVIPSEIIGNTSTSPGSVIYTAIPSIGLCTGPSRQFQVLVNPLNPMDSITQMLPADGTDGLSLPFNISWAPVPHASHYDIYIWPDSLPAIPAQPFASNIQSINYMISSGLVYGTSYNWRVVAKNTCLSTPGAIQSFSLRHLPDLTVSNVQVPASVLSGEMLSVTWHVNNTGAGSTLSSTWYDYIYLSADTVYQGYDIYLGHIQNVNMLIPGQAYIGSKSVLIPENIFGNYYVIIKPLGLFEENLTNNENHSPAAIQITPPPLPDIAWNSIGCPSAAFGNDSITVVYSMINSGQLAISNKTWYDNIYLSSSPVYSVSNSLYVGTRENQNMDFDIDSVYTRSVRFKVPYTYHGTYYVHVFSDVYNQISESNNNNNVAVSDPLDIILRPPADLVVTGVNAPLTTNAGETIEVSWTVLNQGINAPMEDSWVDKVYLSVLDTFNVSQSLLMSQVSISGGSGLAQDAFYDRSASFIIPYGLSGNYYVYIVADANNNVFEYLYNNNNSGRSSNPVFIENVYADLVVSSTGFTVDTVQPGQIISLSWITRNQGPDVAYKPWWTGLYLSDNTGLNNNYLGLYSDQYPGNNLSFNQVFEQSALVQIPNVLEGWKYLVIVTDLYNNVYETGPGGTNLNFNNTYVCEIPVYVKVPLVEPSDLNILSFEASDSVFSGNDLSISYWVENIGAGSTPETWFDKVYLSSDSILDPYSDWHIHSVYHVGVIPSGQSYQKAATIPIANGIQGDYYLILQLGLSTGSNRELNDENNRRSLPLKITLTDPPDLVLTHVDNQAEAVAGELITVRFTIKNQGSGTTENGHWTEGIYLSPLPFAGGGSIRLGSYTRGGDLISGEEYTDSVQINIPSTFLGMYYVVIQADASNDVYEHQNEGNNTGHQLIFISAPLPSDLVITEVSVPVSTYLGQSITVDYRIRNIGSNRSVGMVKDGMYFSTDSILNTGSDRLLNARNIYLDLMPGDSVDRSMLVKVKDIDPGDYVGISSTDMLNQVMESNESNNYTLADNPTNVGIQQLYFNDPEDTTLLYNDLLYYKLETIGGLDLIVTLSSDEEYGSNEIYAAYNRVPRLDDYDYQHLIPMSTNQTLLIPSCDSGVYYLMFRTTISLPYPQQISILAQALPFSIVNISPKKVGQGKVSCKFTGAGFNDSTSIFLVHNGQQLSAGSIVDLQNSMQMKVSWDLTNIPIGKYPVMAIKGNDTIFAQDSLQVDTVVWPILAIKEYLPASVRTTLNGFFTFRMENQGNVDISYMQFVTLFPASCPILESTTSPNVLTDTDLDLIITDSNTVNGNWQIYNDIQAQHLMVKDLAPNEVFSVSILSEITNVAANEEGAVNIYLDGVVFSGKGFAQHLAAGIEEIREAILSVPDSFNIDIVQMAGDQVLFRDTILKGIVQEGFINADDTIGIAAAFGELYGISYKGENNLKVAKDSPACEKERQKYCDRVKFDCLGPTLIKLGVYGPIYARAGFAYFKKWVISQLRNKVIGYEVNKITKKPQDPCLDLWGCRNVPPSGEGLGIFAKRARMADQVEDESAPLAGGGGPSSGGSDPCHPHNPRGPYSTRIIVSRDPNDITGPNGYTPRQLIADTLRMPYTIRFENDSSIATAAAQRVVITLPVDEKQNIFSFRLGAAGFNNKVFNVPDNSASYTGVIDMPDSLGYDIELTAGIDIVERNAVWVFQTIDPATGLPPANPFLGFLPINDTNGSGQGFVNYTIKPVSGVNANDSIAAIARIVFDMNEPILTNNWVNVIDDLPPVSSMITMPAGYNTSLIPVSFQASDNPGGSGIRKIRLYVSENQGPFTYYSTFDFGQAASFSGQAGYSYDFFSIAVDSVGNTEAMKNAGEANTTIGNWLSPLISVIGNSSFCAGDSVLLKTSSNSSWVYQWMRNDTLIQGAVDSVLYAKTSGQYSVQVTYLNDSVGISPPVPVLVFPLPSIDAGSDTLLLSADTIQLHPLVAGGSLPYTFSWTPSEFFNDPAIREPEVYSDSTQLFMVQVTDFMGCTQRDSILIERVPAGLTYVFGKYSYFNSSLTPMKNQVVELKNSLNETWKDTTDLNGDFIVQGIAPGDYILSASPGLSWGGANAIDALQVMQHFVLFDSLSGLSKTAADVDGSSTINAIDALLIQRRFVGFITSFPAGDWTSISDTFTADGLSPVNRNIFTLCTGDVNASFIPGVGPKSAAAILVSGKEIAEPDEVINLPVRTGGALDLNAVSLVLHYPSSIMEVLDIQLFPEYKGEPASLTNPEFLYNITGDEIRLSWSSLETWSFEPNDILLNLKVKCKTGSFNSWKTGPETALAGPGAVEIKDVQFIIPGLEVLSEGFELGAPSPNPFMDKTEIAYTIPQDGKVTLTVTDMLGQVIKILVDRKMSKGRYTQWVDASDLTPGMYLYTLDFENDTQHLQKTQRMIVSKK